MNVIFVRQQLARRLGSDRSLHVYGDKNVHLFTLADGRLRIHPRYKHCGYFRKSFRTYHIDFHIGMSHVAHDASSFHLIQMFPLNDTSVT
jgi:hypothetical protein